MPLELAAQQLGVDPAIAVDQRDASLIAAGLDAEHDRRAMRARFRSHDRWR
jgi:hypothetical protein